jgi:Xaa-Pro aminopeptidase
MFENSEIVNISTAIRLQRSIKTEFEIEKIRQCAEVHSEAYAIIPSLYKEGMTDMDFSIEIEHTLRKMGHLGIFRTFGGKMEAFMGSILAGDNASAISPFDFALGGGGHPSLPIGANGTVIQNGMSVMVDVSCNINGYITDMTRTFYKGDLPQEAYTAHNVSIEIQNVLCDMLLNSTGEEMYLKSVEIAKSYGLEHCYMGSEILAKFVGHGMGLEINELPVIAPRSGGVSPNTVLALEPKFVIKGVGAVGTENTYLVTESKVEKLTTAEEQLIKL